MARTTTTSSRSTAWKAVGATAVGVVLLGAGGATFAEWSDSEQSATGTTITAGVLDLAAGEGRWTNVAGTTVTEAVESGSYLIVPGDALTYSETLTIDAKGDLLTGVVSHTLNDLDGDNELRTKLIADASMTLNGVAVEGTSAPVTADDDLQTVDVAVTIAFDGATNELVGQGQSVALGGLDITLTQAQPVTAN